MSENVDETTVVEPEEEFKLSLEVNITDVGPCKKHVSVKVPRADLDHFHDKASGELVSTADVPGFRIGHVPKQLIEKRFKSELADQVRQNVLMGSLEQLAQDNDLDPINEPEIDVENLKIPEEGDFEFEFDVEVRPEFDLPSYDGIKIEKPVAKTTDEDVDNYLERFLSQYGQLVPHEGAAEADDYLSLSIKFEHDGKQLHSIESVTARLKPTLRFQDAELDGFDKLFIGASAEDTKEAELTISKEAETLEMRNEKVTATFTLNDVKRLELPELDTEFLERIGVESEEGLRTEVKSILERQATYEQRQSARKQVLEAITEAADWDLPEDMVLKQVENALRREVLEMQQAGFTQQDIQARENELRQRAVTTTEQALKEHFVLDKVATEEDIEVLPHDIEGEIQMMAQQRGENPRRVRARMQKSGMIENLEAQIRERKAIDFILEKAVFEEVESKPAEESNVEAIAESVCGQIATSSVSAAADEDAEEGEE